MHPCRQITDIAILGGGLAGLTAAIHLALQGFRVVVLEQGDYPRHKVCGEYLSREVEPYLQSLGVELAGLQPKLLSRLLLSGPGGAVLRSDLPLGGISLSRYALDHALALRAGQAGAEVHTSCKVRQVKQSDTGYEIHTHRGEVYQARQVLAAFGKRSLLDKALSRPFLAKPAPWLGIKYHMEAPCPEDEVQLHLFPGGYCGVSKVETGLVNVCYLVREEQLKRFGTIRQLEERALSLNPYLRRVLQEGRTVWEKPLTISNISFAPKRKAEQGMLMAGDSAGLISPLCGNGMAMAILSARLAAECLTAQLDGKQKEDGAALAYRRLWRKQFGHRMWWGRQIQAAFGSAVLSDSILYLGKYFPRIVHQIISQTHGPRPSTPH